MLESFVHSSVGVRSMHAIHLPLELEWELITRARARISSMCASKVAAEETARVKAAILADKTSDHTC